MDVFDAGTVTLEKLGLLMAGQREQGSSDQPLIH
jgi:hypothetical protein